MNEMLQLLDKGKVVQGLSPQTPSSSTPDYVSMKNYDRLTILISCANAGSASGAAVALKQATAVDGSDEKALEFDTVYANEDTGDSDTLVETTVSSNTFDTDDTDNDDLLYVIEVKAEDLDADNDFDCVRASIGDPTNQVVDILYILHGPRYAPSLDESAITD